jgi:hypothetical protein
VFFKQSGTNITPLFARFIIHYKFRRIFACATPAALPVILCPRGFAAMGVLPANAVSLF